MALRLGVIAQQFFQVDESATATALSEEEVPLVPDSNKEQALSRPQVTPAQQQQACSSSSNSSNKNTPCHTAAQNSITHTHSAKRGQRHGGDGQREGSPSRTFTRGCKEHKFLQGGNEAVSQDIYNNAQTQDNTSCNEGEESEEADARQRSCSPSPILPALSTVEQLIWCPPLLRYFSDTDALHAVTRKYHHHHYHNRRRSSVNSAHHHTNSSSTSNGHARHSSSDAGELRTPLCFPATLDEVLNARRSVFLPTSTGHVETTKNTSGESDGAALTSSTSQNNVMGEVNGVEGDATASSPLRNNSTATKDSGKRRLRRCSITSEDKCNDEESSGDECSSEDDNDDDDDEENEVDDGTSVGSLPPYIRTLKAMRAECARLAAFEQQHRASLQPTLAATQTSSKQGNARNTAHKATAHTRSQASSSTTSTSSTVRRKHASLALPVYVYANYIQLPLQMAALSYEHLTPPQRDGLNALAMLVQSSNRALQTQRCNNNPTGVSMDIAGHSLSTFTTASTAQLVRDEADPFGAATSAFSVTDEAAQTSHTHMTNAELLNEAEDTTTTTVTSRARQTSVHISTRTTPHPTPTTGAATGWPSCAATMPHRPPIQPPRTILHVLNELVQGLVCRDEHDVALHILLATAGWSFARPGDRLVVYFNHIRSCLPTHKLSTAMLAMEAWDMLRVIGASQREYLYIAEELVSFVLNLLVHGHTYPEYMTALVAIPHLVTWATHYAPDLLDDNVPELLMAVSALLEAPHGTSQAERLRQLAANALASLFTLALERGGAGLVQTVMAKIVNASMRTIAEVLVQQQQEQRLQQVTQVQGNTKEVKDGPRKCVLPTRHTEGTKGREGVSETECQKNTDKVTTKDNKETVNSTTVVQPHLTTSPVVNTPTISLALPSHLPPSSTSPSTSLWVRMKHAVRSLVGADTASSTSSNRRQRTGRMNIDSDSVRVGQTRAATARRSVHGSQPASTAANALGNTRNSGSSSNGAAIRAAARRSSTCSTSKGSGSAVRTVSAMRGRPQTTQQQKSNTNLNDEKDQEEKNNNNRALLLARRETTRVAVTAGTLVLGAFLCAWRAAGRGRWGFDAPVTNNNEAHTGTTTKEAYVGDSHATDNVNGELNALLAHLPLLPVYDEDTIPALQGSADVAHSNIAAVYPRTLMAPQRVVSLSHSAGYQELQRRRASRGVEPGWHSLRRSVSNPFLPYLENQLTSSTYLFAAVTPATSGHTIASGERTSGQQGKLHSATTSNEVATVATMDGTTEAIVPPSTTTLLQTTHDEKVCNEKNDGEAEVQPTTVPTPGLELPYLEYFLPRRTVAAWLRLCVATSTLPTSDTPSSTSEQHDSCCCYCWSAGAQGAMEALMPLLAQHYHHHLDPSLTAAVLQRLVNRAITNLKRRSTRPNAPSSSSSRPTHRPRGSEGTKETKNDNDSDDVLLRASLFLAAIATSQPALFDSVLHTKLYPVLFYGMQYQSTSPTYDPTAMPALTLLVHNMPTRAILHHCVPLVERLFCCALQNPFALDRVVMAAHVVGVYRDLEHLFFTLTLRRIEDVLRDRKGSCAPMIRTSGALSTTSNSSKALHMDAVQRVKLQCFRVLCAFATHWAGAAMFFDRVCVPYFTHTSVPLRRASVESCVRFLLSDCLHGYHDTSPAPPTTHRDDNENDGRNGEEGNTHQHNTLTNSNTRSDGVGMCVLHGGPPASMLVGADVQRAVKALQASHKHPPYPHRRPHELVLPLAALPHNMGSNNGVAGVAATVFNEDDVLAAAVDEKDSHHGRTHVGVLRQIIHRLVEVAVGDADELIRFRALRSLSPAFYHFLYPYSCVLHCLIQALDDSFLPNQVQAARILCALLPYNATCIYPSLRNRLLRQLDDSAAEVSWNVAMLATSMTGLNERREWGVYDRHNRLRAGKLLLLESDARRTNQAMLPSSSLEAAENAFYRAGRTRADTLRPAGYPAGMNANEQQQRRRQRRGYRRKARQHTLQAPVVMEDEGYTLLPWTTRSGMSGYSGALTRHRYNGSGLSSTSSGNRNGSMTHGSPSMGASHNALFVTSPLTWAGMQQQHQQRQLEGGLYSLRLSSTMAHDVRSAYAALGIVPTQFMRICHAGRSSTTNTTSGTTTAGVRCVTTRGGPCWLRCCLLQKEQMAVLMELVYALPAVTTFHLHRLLLLLQRVLHEPRSSRGSVLYTLQLLILLNEHSASDNWRLFCPFVALVARQLTIRDGDTARMLTAVATLQSLLQSSEAASYPAAGLHRVVHYLHTLLYQKPSIGSEFSIAIVKLLGTITSLEPLQQLEGYDFYPGLLRRPQEEFYLPHLNTYLHVERGSECHHVRVCTFAYDIEEEELNDERGGGLPLRDSAVGSMPGEPRTLHERARLCDGAVSSQFTTLQAFPPVSAEAALILHYQVDRFTPFSPCLWPDTVLRVLLHTLVEYLGGTISLSPEGVVACYEAIVDIVLNTEVLQHLSLYLPTILGLVTDLLAGNHPLRGHPLLTGPLRPLFVSNAARVVAKAGRSLAACYPLLHAFVMQNWQTERETMTACCNVVQSFCLYMPDLITEHCKFWITRLLDVLYGYARETPFDADLAPPMRYTTRPSPTTANATPTTTATTTTPGITTSQTETQAKSGINEESHTNTPTTTTGNVGTTLPQLSAAAHRTSISAPSAPSCAASFASTATTGNTGQSRTRPARLHSSASWTQIYWTLTSTLRALRGLATPRVRAMMCECLSQCLLRSRTFISPTTPTTMTNETQCTCVVEGEGITSAANSPTTPLVEDPIDLMTDERELFAATVNRYLLRTLVEALVDCDVDAIGMSIMQNCLAHLRYFATVHAHALHTIKLDEQQGEADTQSRALPLPLLTPRERREVALRERRQRLHVRRAEEEAYWGYDSPLLWLTLRHEDRESRVVRHFPLQEVLTSWESFVEMDLLACVLLLVSSCRLPALRFELAVKEYLVQRFGPESAVMAFYRCLCSSAYKLYVHPPSTIAEVEQRVRQSTRTLTPLLPHPTTTSDGTSSVSAMKIATAAQTSEREEPTQVTTAVATARGTYAGRRTSAKEMRSSVTTTPSAPTLSLDYHQHNHHAHRHNDPLDEDPTITAMTKSGNEAETHKEAPLTVVVPTMILGAPAALELCTDGNTTGTNIQPHTATTTTTSNETVHSTRLTSALPSTASFTQDVLYPFVTLTASAGSNSSPVETTVTSAWNESDGAMMMMAAAATAGATHEASMHVHQANMSATQGPFTHNMTRSTSSHSATAHVTTTTRSSSEQARNASGHVVLLPAVSSREMSDSGTLTASAGVNAPVQTNASLVQGESRVVVRHSPPQPAASSSSLLLAATTATTATETERFGSSTKSTPPIPLPTRLTAMCDEPLLPMSYSQLFLQPYRVSSMSDEVSSSFALFTPTSSSMSARRRSLSSSLHPNATTTTMTTTNAIHESSSGPLTYHGRSLLTRHHVGSNNIGHHATSMANSSGTSGSMHSAPRTQAGGGILPRTHNVHHSNSSDSNGVHTEAVAAPVHNEQTVHTITIATVDTERPEFGLPALAPTDTIASNVVAVPTMRGTNESTIAAAVSHNIHKAATSLPTMLRTPHYTPLNASEEIAGGHAGPVNCNTTTPPTITTPEERVLLCDTIVPESNALLDHFLSHRHIRSSREWRAWFEQFALRVVESSPEYSVLACETLVKQHKLSIVYSDLLAIAVLSNMVLFSAGELKTWVKGLCEFYTYHNDVPQLVAAELARMVHFIRLYRRALFPRRLVENVLDVYLTPDCVAEIARRALRPSLAFIHLERALIEGFSWPRMLMHIAISDDMRDVYSRFMAMNDPNVRAKLAEVAQTHNEASTNITNKERYSETRNALPRRVGVVHESEFAAAQYVLSPMVIECLGWSDVAAKRYLAAYPALLSKLQENDECSIGRDCTRKGLANTPTHNTQEECETKNEEGKEEQPLIRGGDVLGAMRAYIRYFNFEAVLNLWKVSKTMPFLATDDNNSKDSNNRNSVSSKPRAVSVPVNVSCYVAFAAEALSRWDVVEEVLLYAQQHPCAKTGPAVKGHTIAMKEITNIATGSEGKTHRPHKKAGRKDSRHSHNTDAKDGTENSDDDDVSGETSRAGGELKDMIAHNEVNAAKDDDAKSCGSSSNEDEDDEDDVKAAEAESSLHGGPEHFEESEQTDFTRVPLYTECDFGITKTHDGSQEDCPLGFQLEIFACAVHVANRRYEETKTILGGVREALRASYAVVHTENTRLKQNLQCMLQQLTDLEEGVRAIELTTRDQYATSRSPMPPSANGGNNKEMTTSAQKTGFTSDNPADRSAAVEPSSCENNNNTSSSSISGEGLTADFASFTLQNISREVRGQVYQEATVRRLWNIASRPLPSTSTIPHRFEMIAIRGVLVPMYWQLGNILALSEHIVREGLPMRAAHTLYTFAQMREEGDRMVWGGAANEYDTTECPIAASSSSSSTMNGSRNGSPSLAGFAAAAIAAKTTTKTPAATRHAQRCYEQALQLERFRCLIRNCDRVCDMKELYADITASLRLDLARQRARQREQQGLCVEGDNLSSATATRECSQNTSSPQNANRSATRLPSLTLAGMISVDELAPTLSSYQVNLLLLSMTCRRRLGYLMSITRTQRGPSIWPTATASQYGMNCDTACQRPYSPSSSPPSQPPTFASVLVDPHSPLSATLARHFPRTPPANVVSRNSIAVLHSQLFPLPQQQRRHPSISVSASASAAVLLQEMPSMGIQTPPPMQQGQHSQLISLSSLSAVTTPRCRPAGGLTRLATAPNMTMAGEAEPCETSAMRAEEGDNNNNSATSPTMLTTLAFSDDHTNHHPVAQTQSGEAMEESPNHTYHTPTTNNAFFSEHCDSAEEVLTTEGALLAEYYLLEHAMSATHDIPAVWREFGLLLFDVCIAMLAEWERTGELATLQNFLQHAPMAIRALQRAARLWHSAARSSLGGIGAFTTATPRRQRHARTALPSTHLLLKAMYLATQCEEVKQRLAHSPSMLVAQTDPVNEDTKDIAAKEENHATVALQAILAESGFAALDFAPSMAVHWASILPFLVAGATKYPSLHEQLKQLCLHSRYFLYQAVFLLISQFEHHGETLFPQRIDQLPGTSRTLRERRSTANAFPCSGPFAAASSNNAAEQSAWPTNYTDPMEQDLNGSSSYARERSRVKWGPRSFILRDLCAANMHYDAVIRQTMRFCQFVQSASPGRAMELRLDGTCKLPLPLWALPPELYEAHSDHEEGSSDEDGTDTTEGNAEAGGRRGHGARRSRRTSEEDSTTSESDIESENDDIVGGSATSVDVAASGQLSEELGPTGGNGTYTTTTTTDSSAEMATITTTGAAPHAHSCDPSVTLRTLSSSHTTTTTMTTTVTNAQGASPAERSEGQPHPLQPYISSSSSSSVSFPSATLPPITTTTTTAVESSSPTGHTQGTSAVVPDTMNTPATATTKPKSPRNPRRNGSHRRRHARTSVHDAEGVLHVRRHMVAIPAPQYAREELFTLFLSNGYEVRFHSGVEKNAIQESTVTCSLASEEMTTESTAAGTYGKSIMSKHAKGKKEETIVVQRPYSLMESAVSFMLGHLPLSFLRRPFVLPVSPLCFITQLPDRVTHVTRWHSSLPPSLRYSSSFMPAPVLPSSLHVLQCEYDQHQSYADVAAAASAALSSDQQENNTCNIDIAALDERSGLHGSALGRTDEEEEDNVSPRSNQYNADVTAESEAQGPMRGLDARDETVRRYVHLVTQAFDTGNAQPLREFIVRCLAARPTSQLLRSSNDAVHEANNDYDDESNRTQAWYRYRAGLPRPEEQLIALLNALCETERRYGKQKSSTRSHTTHHHRHDVITTTETNGRTQAAKVKESHAAPLITRVSRRPHGRRVRSAPPFHHTRHQSTWRVVRVAKDNNSKANTLERRETRKPQLRVHITLPSTETRTRRLRDESNTLRLRKERRQAIRLVLLRGERGRCENALRDAFGADAADASQYLTTGRVYAQELAEVCMVGYMLDITQRESGSFFVDPASGHVATHLLGTHTLQPIRAVLDKMSAKADVEEVSEERNGRRDTWQGGTRHTRNNEGYSMYTPNNGSHAAGGQSNPFDTARARYTASLMQSPFPCTDPSLFRLTRCLALALPMKNPYNMFLFNAAEMLFDWYTFVRDVSGIGMYGLDTLTAFTWHNNNSVAASSTTTGVSATHHKATANVNSTITTHRRPRAATQFVHPSRRVSPQPRHRRSCSPPVMRSVMPSLTTNAEGTSTQPYATPNSTSTIDHATRLRSIQRVLPRCFDSASLRTKLRNELPLVRLPAAERRSRTRIFAALRAQRLADEREAAALERVTTTGAEGSAIDNMDAAETQDADAAALSTNIATTNKKAGSLAGSSSNSTTTTEPSTLHDPALTLTLLERQPIAGAQNPLTSSVAHTSKAESSPNAPHEGWLPVTTPSIAVTTGNISAPSTTATTPRHANNTQGNTRDDEKREEGTPQSKTHQKSLLDKALYEEGSEEGFDTVYNFVTELIQRATDERNLLGTDIAPHSWQCWAPHW